MTILPATRLQYCCISSIGARLEEGVALSEHVKLKRETLWQRRQQLLHLTPGSRLAVNTSAIYSQHALIPQSTRKQHARSTQATRSQRAINMARVHSAIPIQTSSGKYGAHATCQVPHRRYISTHQAIHTVRNQYVRFSTSHAYRNLSDTDGALSKLWVPHPLV